MEHPGRRSAEAFGRSALLCVFLAASLPGLCGCTTFIKMIKGNKFVMHRADITISMGKELQTGAGIYPSVEVDVVGLTESEVPRWQAYSMNDYFQAECKFRASAERHPFTFSDIRHDPVTIGKKDPLWTQWKRNGATHLCITANIPGVWQDQAGVDGRKLILPLDKKKWHRHSRYEIFLMPDGIVCRTRMKSPEK